MLLAKVENVICVKVENVMSVICVMTMKNNTKIEEGLTCRFKIDMNFTRLDLSTRSA